MKSLFTLLCLQLVWELATGQQSILSSPDKRIRVTIHTGRLLGYQVDYDQRSLMPFSAIDLRTRTAAASEKNSIRSKVTRSVNTVIHSPVPEKRKSIPDQFNEINIRFKSRFSLVFRVYNDGIAYRWLTHFPDSVEIMNELAQFNFQDNPPVYYPEVVQRENTDIFHTSFEEPYQYHAIDSIPGDKLLFNPVLVCPDQRPRIVITESDLLDYPGMFLEHTIPGGLQGRFAPVPAAFRIAAGEFPQQIVTERQPFIASIAGVSSLPWRVLLIAPEDRLFPENDLVYRLASPSKITDHSWIKPGKGTDEWIIGINLFNIPFKAGINTATYKYYIDFAKKFGFQRIMLDAGWSDNNDLFKVNPELNMDSLAAYARSNGISLSMWTLAMTLDRQLDSALAQFKKWGVDFIMTDFMDRDDQTMVRFLSRIAEACGREQMMIMFHGSYKPAGFNRTYPHAVTREGVLGSEFNIWSDKPSPEHNLLLPFIRMVSGPMDYEPGLLNNATATGFRPNAENVMSTGTRAHQAAMFVVYESPIQIFSGNPSQGLLEPDFMELIGSVPTVWDTTMVLDGKVGDYIITARKSGTSWYIGCMTDWSARDLEIDLSFIGRGEFELTVCADGVNADRYPADYIIKKTPVQHNQKIAVRLARGGGQLLRISPLTDLLPPHGVIQSTEVH